MRDKQIKLYKGDKMIELNKEEMTEITAGESKNQILWKSIRDFIYNILDK